jgi:fido (protein-threonine AMPylation protein)
MAEDPYVYPGTGTLRNNLEMRDPTELSQAEADIVGLALRALVDEPLPGDAAWRISHTSSSQRRPRCDVQCASIRWMNA